MAKGWASPHEKGFTLIEMMVVLAIIALVTVLALPSIASYFRVTLTETSREMAGVIKESYNAAVITGRVYRIVYDLKKNEYWVESSLNSVLLDTKESKEKEERRKKFASILAVAPESPFSMDKSITRKKKSLPTGASFEDLISEQSPDPIIEGLAYTHFFSNGIVEQSIIHLKDNSEHHISLVLKPVGGQIDVYDRYANAKEIFGTP